MSHLSSGIPVKVGAIIFMLVDPVLEAYFYSTIRRIVDAQGHLSHRKTVKLVCPFDPEDWAMMAILD